MDIYRTTLHTLNVGSFAHPRPQDPVSGPTSWTRSAWTSSRISVTSPSSRSSGRAMNGFRLGVYGACITDIIPKIRNRGRGQWYCMLHYVILNHDCTSTPSYNMRMGHCFPSGSSTWGYDVLPRYHTYFSSLFFLCPSFHHYSSGPTIRVFLLSISLVPFLSVYF